MTIADIIANPGDDGVFSKRSGQISHYPELCGILLNYYNEISLLKPPVDQHSFDTKKLLKIVYTTFNKIVLQITLIREKNISALVSDTLYAIRLLHLEKFGESGPVLDQQMKLVIHRYQSFNMGLTDDFICLFLAEINKRGVGRKAAAIPIKQNGDNCLLWRSNNLQKKELEWWVNKTDWFERPFSISIIFTINSDVRLDIAPKRIRHVSLFLRLLKKEHLIEADEGTGYMELASKFIYYRGKQVKASKLNSLNSETLKNPEKYAHIIEEVTKVVASIKKAIAVNKKNIPAKGSRQ